MTIPNEGPACLAEFLSFLWDQFFGLEARFAWRALKYLNLQERPGNFARTLFPLNILVLPVFHQFASLGPLSEEKKLFV